MPIDLESLRIFVKVAELGSFTRAAEQLGIPKARVSTRVQHFEHELGARLLQRSTRVVRLTSDGEQLMARARNLLSEFEELSTLFQSARSLRGRVRIDMPVSIARDLVFPRLPELLGPHPELHVVVSTTDRLVEVLREGFDCVLRVGEVRDSELVRRRLGTYRMMNCVSPSYARRYGLPQRLEDLDRHYVVHYSANLGGESPTFEYPEAGRYRQWPMRSLVTVNGVDAYLAACLAGLGIIQSPRSALLALVMAGDLVEVLPNHQSAPMPVTLLHAHGKQPPRRVRVVITWLTELLTPHFQLLGSLVMILASADRFLR